MMVTSHCETCHAPLVTQVSRGEQESGLPQIVVEGVDDGTLWQQSIQVSERSSTNGHLITTAICLARHGPTIQVVSHVMGTFKVNVSDPPG